MGRLGPSSSSSRSGNRLGSSVRRGEGREQSPSHLRIATLREPKPLSRVLGTPRAAGCTRQPIPGAQTAQASLRLITRQRSRSELPLCRDGNAETP
ncbi:hypothetical protein NDU88_006512 [Pleurodeles waltl]|uniref:Uncharacterized protein n=1 Tax=Pleurodeles waltl TaxID=8319 RepID=A0AAV7N165_PLEWA|nr:hypothetical protein NDU88_006512 [Pleurodeles waltl]